MARIADSSHIDKKSEALVGELQKEVITEVRRFRNDQGVKPAQKSPGRFIGSADVTAIFQAQWHFCSSSKLQISHQVGIC